MYILFSWIFFLLVAIGNISPDITQCGNLTCYNFAKCTAGARCICKIGYKGTTCIDDFDECSLGDPCLHRGHCQNSIGSYRCECLEGWTGEHSHCSYRDNSTVHHCTQGWFGDMCQDKCLNNSMCRATEVCKRYGRGHHCVCASGWHGPKCTTDMDECKGNPCPKNTVCMNTLGSYMCKCQSGWKGINCDEDINECLINTCKHSSKCVNAAGYYNCTCEHGWDGVYCDEDIDECANNPCNTSLHCNNIPGSFSCVDLPKNYNEMQDTNRVYIIVGSVLGAAVLTVAVLFVIAKYIWKSNK